MFMYITHINNAMENEMNTLEIMELARKHANNGSDMQSSAVLCLQDAEQLHAHGNDAQARVRAIRSLQYSVGVFHPAYQEAVLLAD